MIINENAISKIDNIANNVADIPLKPANKIVDKIVDPIKNIPRGQQLLTSLKKDPSKLSQTQNAKEWSTVMGVSSLISHAPQIASGDLITPLALAAGNATKGATIGPLLSGGQDSLLKSVVVPAGVVAITTPLINDVGDGLGLGDNIDYSPEARVGLTGGIGAGLWAFKNRYNKNKKFI